MTAEPCLPADNHCASDFSRTGNPHLRCEHREGPDHRIVPKLNKVVDLCARSDPGNSDRPAVDGRVRPHLDIVPDEAPADLGDLSMGSSFEDIPETIHANPDTRMEDDPVAKGSPRIEDHMRVEDAPLSDSAFASDHRMCPDPGPIADRHPRLQDRIRACMDSRSQCNPSTKDGSRMNLGFRIDLGMEELEQACECTMRVRNDQAGAAIVSESRS
jgi:hypothetical protein